MTDQELLLLTQLATKLGTTVEFLWAVLLKQAFVSGIKSIIAIVLMWSITISLVVFLVKKKFENESPEAILGAIFASILGLVSILLLLLEGGSAITALFNPEYWALNHIAYMFR
jgi:hypothetical protein